MKESVLSLKEKHWFCYFQFGGKYMY